MLPEFNNKPSLRGLIVFGVVAAILLIQNGKMPFFYHFDYTSQEIFLLLLLNLVTLYTLFSKNTSQISLNRLHLLLLLLLLFVTLTNFGHWFGIAVMLLFFLLLLLLPHFFAAMDLAGLIAASSVIAAVLSLFEYQCFKLGIYGQFPILGWLTGLKDSIAYFGVYGQVNLLACLMLLGCFFYLQLLAVSDKQLWLSWIPLVLLSTVLFLTRSRSGLLALGISSLLLFYLVYKKQLLRTYKKILVCSFIAVIAGFLLASFLGTTSFDKVVQSSQYSSGDPSSFARFNLWASAVAIGVDHPWMGVGIEGYKKALGEYARPVADKLHIGYGTILQTEWAHNDFLQLFAEHGVVFSLLLVIFLVVLIRSSWKTVDNQNLFMLPALAGFMVFMGFGHPFRYPALAFCLLACLSLLLERIPKIFVIRRRHFKVFLLVAMVFVNVRFVPHVWADYQLNQFISYYKAQGGLSLEEFQQISNTNLSWDLNYSAYAWRFQHELYIKLASKVFSSRDAKMAAYLLPQVLQYKQQNSFASIAYIAAQLAYVLHDYQQAKKLAQEAFRKKPDVNIYSNLIHLCNVMLISKSTHRSVVAMTGEKMFQKMKDADMIHPSQLDVLGVAR